MRILLVVFLLSAAVARADSPVVVLTDVALQQRAAKPMGIIAPTFPPAALAEKVTGTVDVIGDIGEDGKMRVTRMEAAPDREDFKAAVRDVIGLWRFSPRYEQDCKPHATPGQVRIWFEMKEGKPAISVSRPLVSDDTSPPEPEKILKAIRRTIPKYPMAAVRAGVDGRIDAYVRVTPEGEVDSLEIAPNLLPVQFERAVRDAVYWWKFEPRPGGKTVCGYDEFVFTLR